MSRPTIPPQRNLTLTEELEKLEQSITLTLQEIDSNFSRAHRIVTTSILPIVEQYAEHSRDVWEGAKFWKQFFEASANVSLSGYEDQPNEDATEQEPTVTEGDTTAADTTQTAEEHTSYEDQSSQHIDLENEEDEDLNFSSLSLSQGHSTPRVHPSQKTKIEDDVTSSSIPYPSPYETLRQEVVETEAPSVLRDAAPSTPGKFTSRTYDITEDISVTPGSSPFIPPASHIKQETAQKSKYQKPTDPVLHRVLDKTYRVQATPLGKGYGNTRSKFAITPKTKPASKYNFDDSPISSPEPEAPQLHAEIFSSPLKGETPATNRKRRTSSIPHMTPKPGISVLTPAKKFTGKSAIFDSDDDLDNEDEFGYSPPKTMQFHIPQSRLMKTPAKEASRRIVEDLLATAGGDDISDTYDEQSPSVIGRAKALEDETF
ncbi:hypothetical protein DTO164E3_3540 [Paecilomyces variotii]|nr:hypothetical protein DTO164E3_3540 [Paecilomyces variotii]KAJ9204767.1 hypothetical protein DTO032I3_2512 [Paecilomyces variotii]KAJ9279867.1 hypothetical protein DTO021D3_3372 [Paecilomyces variotii]KAJ9338876.1 hypothetical protein DTO027B6_8580 [Paecilomyces variotii]KAJ9347711.1 hypothetical protein DTO027B9_8934 [Paecilomyces variotii]